MIDPTILGLTAPWGSVRNEIRIHADPHAVWERIADVADNASWFTSLVRSWCETDPDSGRPIRKVVTPTGVTMVEDIVLVDHAQRRMQYQLRPNGVVTHHLATIDVIDLRSQDGAPSTAERCLVVYSTDLAPRPLALPFAAAAQRALMELKSQMERG
jgi:hypothetical protein